mmetsp:Transcript_28924/g.94571  ORF Transcript_28924/g.94571 Transcript_28924/m.94571 type:complete len:256 (+) Transcript_28924:719-1486(+)
MGGSLSRDMGRWTLMRSASASSSSIRRCFSSSSARSLAISPRWISSSRPAWSAEGLGPPALPDLPPPERGTSSSFERCASLRERISRRSSLISLMRETFSCMIRMLSVRWNSMSLWSLRLSDSTDFSRYSRWRLYSFWMSSSISFGRTCSVTCFWYRRLTLSLSALGSWMCCVVSCRSWWKRRMSACESELCLRCTSTSFCKPSSLSLRSEMVRSRLALFLWYRSSSWSISLICSFMSAISSSRGSICFLSSLIL